MLAKVGRDECKLNSYLPIARPIYTGQSSRPNLGDIKHIINSFQIVTCMVAIKLGKSVAYVSHY